MINHSEDGKVCADQCIDIGVDINKSQNQRVSNQWCKVCMMG